MEKSKMRPLLGGFLYMALFGLFGAPSAPTTELVPTVGGYALAEPCDEAWNSEDCEPTEPPVPVPEPPPPPEECRSDAYECAPERVPADCTSMPAVLGYAAVLATLAAFAVPPAAIVAAALGLAAYYVTATCELLDNE